MADGDPTTAYESAEPAATGDWVRLDLHTERRVEAVSVLLGRPDGSHVPVATDLEASADGEQWTVLRSDTRATEIHHTPPAPLTARFLRLRHTSPAAGPCAVRAFTAVAEPPEKSLVMPRPAAWHGDWTWAEPLLVAGTATGPRLPSWDEHVIHHADEGDGAADQPGRGAVLGGRGFEDVVERAVDRLGQGVEGFRPVGEQAAGERREVRVGGGEVVVVGVAVGGVRKRVPGGGARVAGVAHHAEFAQWLSVGTVGQQRLVEVVDQEPAGHRRFGARAGRDVTREGRPGGWTVGSQRHGVQADTGRLDEPGRQLHEALGSGRVREQVLVGQDAGRADRLELDGLGLVRLYQ
ncbi:discoidin domain-containing protein [Streptomyces sp. CJ_13]|uniref:discoidin domain-containing protein n=1 Tax=Streptomyces sp. CJ_13 TaxID=2724943 RepID=UPI0035B384E4